MRLRPTLLRLSAGPAGLNFFALRWLGNTNATYRVQWCQSLEAWNQSITAPTHLGEGLYQWTDAASANVNRFYRVIRY